MAFEPLPIVEVPIGDLRLDLENYRIPVRPDDEAAALKFLVASEQVLDQIKLFLRDGYFDNEVPIVVREYLDDRSAEEQTVVLEGNRRVSALKLIHDPGLVAEHEAEVTALLTRYAKEVDDMPTTIRVIVAPSRDIARPHIARLHTGVPKKRWSRDQQANYYHSLLGPTTTLDDLKGMYPDAPILRFLRMVEMRQFLDGVRFSDRSLNGYVRSDALTMSAFEYAFRPTEIAESMGVVFDGHRISPATKSARAIGASLTKTQRQAVEYLMQGFRSGTFNTRSPEFKKGSDAKSDLLAILRGEPSEPVPDPADDEDPPDQDSGSGGTGSGGPGPGGPGLGGPGRGPNNPDTAKGLPIGGLPLGDVHANLRRRYVEMRSVEVARTPAAAAMLLRSVLEATIKHHFAGTEHRVSGELGKCLPTVVNVYGAEREYRAVIQTIRSGRTDRPGSLSWFNAAAHNPDFPIEEADVRSAHRLVESLLKLLLIPHRG